MTNPSGRTSAFPWLVALAGCAGCHGAQPSHRTTIPTMQVPHAHGVIEADGRLSEPDWAHAADTGALIDTLSGAVDSPRNAQGRVKVLWDETALHVAFVIADSTQVDRGVGQIDPHPWEDDCAEVMLDPGAVPGVNARDYFELQVGPRGSMFDTRYTSPRVPPPFGLTRWASGAERAVVSNAEGYTVEMNIPWTGLGVPSVHAGDDLRANFYLMDRTSPQAQRFGGWSATLVGDFHVPARFGHLVLAP